MSDEHGSTYAEQVVALYRGELYGQLLFDALAERTDEPEHAAMWRRLIDVEQLTAKRLEARARAFGAEHEAQLQLAHARLRRQMEALAGKSTREICEFYQARVPDNVARLQALRAEAPSCDHALLTQVIAHSAAFGSCLEHWLAGDLLAAENVLRNYLEDCRPDAAAG